MEPAVRIASDAAEPVIRELLVAGEETSGGPELLAALTTFRGADPSTGYADLLHVARELTRLARRHTHFTPMLTKVDGVEDVLARTLWTVGELDVTDEQAVRLGPQDFARRLRSAVPGADRELSSDAAWFHDSLLVTVCLHLLNQLLQRSPALAGRLAERSHRIGQLVDLNDAEVVRGRRAPSAEDAPFEERYRRSLVEQFSRVTIHGIDLPNPNTPGTWPLDATYLSLAAEFDAQTTGGSGTAGSGGDGEGDGEPVTAADRALAGHERVLLRGVAGSGKTTLIQYLALRTARDELPDELAVLRGRIPLVLPVRRFARDGFPPPDEFLSAVRHPLAAEAPDGWVARVLADERALLLVDGIDEAPEAQRTELRAQLRRLLRIYSGNRCLVTSRPPAVDRDWLADEGFSELTLTPMDRDQVAAFITAWHTAAGTDEGKDHAHLDAYRERLLQAVPLHRELRGLATNPLMCGLICALNRDRSGSLPQGRKELYEAAMEMLLQRRDAERRVEHADTVRLHRASRERLLRKLAHRMLTGERSDLDHETALGVLAGALPAIPATYGQGEPEEIFGHLLLRTGLLREQAMGSPLLERSRELGERSVEFVHRTVQDYLAAKEAVDQGDFDLLLRHAHEPEWEEVFRMAVAHARPAECAALLRGLLAPGRTGLQRNRRRLLAAACLEHVTELDPETHERIRRETRNMVRPANAAAARGLGWVGPIVLEMLPDPRTLSDDEAHRAAVTVTRINDDAAVHYLAQLRDRTSLKLRAELARGWRNFETDRYADEVIRHLDPEGLYFPVSDRVELAALQQLGGRERIQVVGRFGVEELLKGLPAQRLTHLWLAYDLGHADMSWLTAFPHLTTLRVNPRLPRVTSVPEGVRILS